MIERLSNRFVDILVLNDIVIDSEKEIYQYGLFIIISSLLTTMAAVGIGLIVGQLFEVVIFLLTFALLRMYSGGLHADTFKQCFVYFIGILGLFIFAKWTITSLPYIVQAIFSTFAIVSSFILVFRYAPVAHPNAPLTETESIKYRQYSRIIWFLESTVVSLLSINRVANSIAISISLALVMTSVLVVVGYTKNRKGGLVQ